jgi:anaerobic ribonucleoside-triphosphate reductase activating protein
MTEVLRVHGFLARSRANGPGLRAVVWTQGCTLACPGCFNPLTHAAAGGDQWQPERLAQHIAGISGIEGVTLSGGEPLQQARPVERLISALVHTNLSILLFTGYSLAEARRRAPAVLALVDVLIAGRFVASRPVGRALVGSANQRVHFLSDRYDAAALARVPAAELTIRGDQVIATGIATTIRSSGEASAQFLESP